MTKATRVTGAVETRLSVLGKAIEAMEDGQVLVSQVEPLVGVGGRHGRIFGRLINSSNVEKRIANCDGDGRVREFPEAYP